MKLFRAFGSVLGGLLVGYLFLDRFFSHIHLPKLKVVFVGELTLLFGVIAVLVGTRWLLSALRRDVVIGSLLGFMGWGAIRALFNLSEFGLQNVVRDSAIWYYGLFGLLFLAASTAVPDLPRKFVRGFRWVLPALSVWLPIGLVLVRSGISGPKPKLSGVALFSHRPGDFCCTAALCLAYLLLIPRADPAHPDPNRLSVRPYATWLYAGLVGLNLFTILLGATQTRGGGFAALVAVILVFVFMERRRRNRVLLTIVASATLLFGLAAITGASYHTSKRTISVSQLFANVQSVTSGSSGSGQLQGSVNFRTALWENVLHEETSSGRFITGLGFGPNLAQIGGIVQKPKNSAAAEQLRSAHNSLLDVLARMGLIGALLFVLSWGGWFFRMQSSRRRRTTDDDTRAVMGICMAASVAVFINAFFDPTLEGAQVAGVLYTLFALGIFCSRGSINPAIEKTARWSRRAIPSLASGATTTD